MARKFVKIGENNGKIYVDSIADKPYRAYNCVCTICGRKFVVQGQDVFKYADTGCGACRIKQQNASRLEDAQKFIGQKFGALEVVEISGFKKFYGRNHITVSCRCIQCGNTAEYLLTKLKSGRVKQCKNCSQLNLRAGHEISKIASISGTSVLAIDGRRKINKNSTTGIKGVSQIAGTGKYRAYIHFRKKQYCLGVFSQLEDAIAARKEAEEKIYGKFLTWYAEAYPEQYKKISKPHDDAGEN